MQREIPWRAKQETLEKPIEIRLKPLTPLLPLPTSLSLPVYISAPARFIYAAASVENQASAVVQHWL